MGLWVPLDRPDDAVSWLLGWLTLDRVRELVLPVGRAELEPAHHAQHFGVQSGDPGFERGLLAGRVIWFYLGKYAWPADVIFIYPRWTVDTGVWWQWLFPVAAVSLLAGFWALRHRARGPLAAYLVFVGSLVPTIGFFNVYAFKFSYVADHWNYLPSLALAVGAAWGAVRITERFDGRADPLGRPPSDFILKR